MRRPAPLLPAIGTLLLLGACVSTPPTDPATGFVTDVPARVTELAAPYQDLSAVQFRRQDGCYWYRYAGPVETTMLPIRTRDGSKICVR
jgi:hypothetical protein